MIVPPIGAPPRPYDVCVIGAGPVGIALALQLGRLGRSVLLVESGELEPREAAQNLAEATLEGPHHVPMSLAVQRRLGGTSNLWGGRCVPLDPIDFGARPVLPGTHWPIDAATAFAHLTTACRYAGCGEPAFDSAPPVPCDDADFGMGRLERWSTRPRFRNAHRRELRDSRAVALRMRTVATGFRFHADGRVRAVRLRGPDGRDHMAEARAVVVAAGGLENARLLLAARTEAGDAFGGDALGRYYMGHVYGTVAEMTLNDPALDLGLAYFDDGRGSYVRRRFTPSAALQAREALTNAALWPEFPPIHNPAHGSGVLSFAYLALSLPPVGRMVVAESVRRAYLGAAPVRRPPHLLNVVRDFPRTATFLPGFIYRRYLARRTMPGFFERNRNRRYAVRYHAEHLPNPESRVCLTQDRDASGLQRLHVHLRYSAADAEPLIRTHALFGDWLRRTGLGELHWSVPKPERITHILGQCYDGHHQIGTTRMADHDRAGVVDRDCRVFGAANLFVAGSSVFPTSGQANPTLTAICLAVRLAETLGQEVGAS